MSSDPRTGGATGRPPAPRRRKLLAALVALVVTAAAVEGLVRLRQYLKYGTTSGTFYELELDPASGLEIPRPGYEEGPLRIDALGFRGPGIEQPKPAGRLRVAFLGGSTTFCAEASSEEVTWPRLVVEGLRARFPGAAFDGVNAGVAGYSTAQSLVNLEHRVRPLAPDVIVIYHGTNDLTQDSRALAVAQGLHDPDRQGESWLARHSLTWYLIEKNLRWRARREAGEKVTLEVEPDVLCAPFRERLTLLVREARELAPVVCLVTFSHRARRDQSPEEQREASASSLFYMPWLSVPDLLDAFEEVNRVIREVARAEGVLLVEGADAIPGDGEHFQDSVHFRDPGLALQAERVLAGLAGSEELAGLVEE